MSVTLDTNVYVSALSFGGRPLRLLTMAQAGALQIDISDQIEEELVRVLREDFGWEGYRIHFLKERLRKITNRVTPTVSVTIVDDPDDNKIIECAVSAGSERIITNDNALLRIGVYQGIAITRMDDFLAQGAMRRG